MSLVDEVSHLALKASICSQLSLSSMMAKWQSTLFSFLKTVGSSGQSSKPDFSEDYTARSESTDVLPAENDTTDISAYAPYSVRRVLTDNQKYSLLTGSHGLSSNYQFPG